jgi:hypothetical protein
MAKPLPWSFSSLNKFVTCPNQYCETKVLKNFKDEPGETALWGTYVHDCIEDAVNTGAAMPDNTKVYGPQIWSAMNGITGAKAEVELALDNKFEPCEWDKAWVRGIIDLLKFDRDEALAIDWKLGKIKPDSKQLKLFALLVFYHYPQMNIVHTSFEWLQFKQHTRETFTRDQIPQLWEVFVGDLGQYARAFKTDTWQKRPSGLCKNYCAVTSCEHNGGWSGKRIKSCI